MVPASQSGRAQISGRSSLCPFIPGTEPVLETSVMPRVQCPGKQGTWATVGTQDTMLRRDSSAPGWTQRTVLGVRHPLKQHPWASHEGSAAGLKGATVF